jgi:hypothetical protein
MKANVTIKALSAAVLGLAGMAYAGSSFAVCPTDPAQSGGGAWTSKSVLGGALTITTPGLGTPPTECKLEAAITSTAFGSAFVRDNTPAGETRYRAQFSFDGDALTGLNSVQSVRLFSANADTPFQSTAEAVRISIFGNLAGTTKSLNVVVACNGAPASCATTVPITTTGTHKLQIDWVKGTTGSLKVWLDNTVEATPTATLSGNTDGWVVDYAILGLSTPSPGFRTAQTNRTVKFDEFDSRRTTFIN